MNNGTTYEQRQGHPRKCTARRQDGKPCGRYAARGGNVCRVHGGGAPQVIAKARERLALAADRMARELLGIATGAESEAVKLAAVKDALDRAGLSPKHAVAVSAADSEPAAPYEQLMGDVMAISKAQHEALKRGELLPAPPELPPTEIYDAELVPEPQEERADRADRVIDPPRRPAWALDDLGPQPSQALVTLEEAQAEANATNRRAKVVRSRRVR
jgi:hypothetical protein